MNNNFIKTSLRQLTLAGYRITAARRSVLEVLAKSQQPLQVNEIHAVLQKQTSSTDLVSVYRILEILLELGVIHRDPEDKGYFPCTHCSSCPDDLHIFLKCTDCSVVREMDFHGEVFSQVFKEKLSKMKSSPRSKKIYLSDLCSICAEIT